MRNVKCSYCDEYRNEWCEKIIDSPHPDILRDCQYFHEAKTRWIPCSERLPNTDLAHYAPNIGIWYSSDIVLVYCNEPDYISESKYMLAYYDRNEGVNGIRYGWSEATTGDEIEPIAWMPLPEPYREGEHNGQTD